MMAQVDRMFIRSGLGGLNLPDHLALSVKEGRAGCRSALAAWADDNAQQTVLCGGSCGKVMPKVAQNGDKWGTMGHSLASTGVFLTVFPVSKAGDVRRRSCSRSALGLVAAPMRPRARESSSGRLGPRDRIQKPLTASTRVTGFAARRCGWTLL